MEGGGPAPEPPPLPHPPAPFLLLLVPSCSHALDLCPSASPRSRLLPVPACPYTTQYPPSLIRGGAHAVGYKTVEYNMVWACRLRQPGAGPHGRWAREPSGPGLRGLGAHKSRRRCSSRQPCWGCRAGRWMDIDHWSPTRSPAFIHRVDESLMPQHSPHCHWALRSCPPCCDALHKSPIARPSDPCSCKYADRQSTPCGKHAAPAPSRMHTTTSMQPAPAPSPAFQPKPSSRPSTC